MADDDLDVKEVRKLLKDKDIKELIKMWKDYNEKKLPLEREGRIIKAIIILALIFTVGILTFYGSITTELTAAVYGGLVTAIMMGKLNF